MIKTGIDIAEPARFAAMNHPEEFAARVYTDAEWQYIKRYKNYAEHMAAFFAAKEAFSKFLGTGIREFSFPDIEVCHEDSGKPYLRFFGERVLADLSISHTEVAAVAVVCGEEFALQQPLPKAEVYRELLPIRREDMHKGDCGRVFLLAGSGGMTGAAVLCGRAALRTGSGLVTVGTPSSEQPILAAQLIEAMTLPLDAENRLLVPGAKDDILKQMQKSDVTALGPGLGKAPGLAEIIKEMLSLRKPMVIDADGLNAISEHMDILQAVCADTVLTPHPGEMARLCGKSVTEIQENRKEIAEAFAKQYGVTLLLKGKDTLIASPNLPTVVNPTGNDGMASGGMGDVLTGVIASLMGQGLSGYRAAVLGAYLHGLAGDIARKAYGGFGMIAGDVAERIPAAIQRLQNG